MVPVLGNVVLSTVSTSMNYLLSFALGAVKNNDFVDSVLRCAVIMSELLGFCSVQLVLSGLLLHREVSLGWLMTAIDDVQNR